MEKKWPLLLRELDQTISNNENFEMDELIVSIFEKIDKGFREEHAQKYYFDLWKIAFRLGKVKLAKSYAEFILDYLIEYKRVPALKQLITDLSTYGLLKMNKKFQMLDLIQGHKTGFPLEDFHSFEFHPEMWKESKTALRDYLTTDTDWSLSHWKLAYEYILKFHYDKEILIMLTSFAIEFKKKDHKQKFISYLNSQKVNTKQFETKKVTPEEKKVPFHADYDQLAMDVMSGSLEPSAIEQKKILVSVNALRDEDLLIKGKDMIIAFGLLGMDQVVVSLCERVVPLLKDMKERISIQYMLAQSLYSSNEFYKVIDLVEDISVAEPLLIDEMVAFDYMKAECFLKMKNYKMAKDLFLKIKKQNPHYRLVGERLKTLEAIK